MKMPDVTPAQIVALVGAIIAVAVAFGAPISDDQRDAILQLVGIVAPALVIGDAVIRNGRSKIAAVREQNGGTELLARVEQLEAVAAEPVDLVTLVDRVRALEAAEGAIERPEA